MSSARWSREIQDLGDYEFVGIAMLPAPNVQLSLNPPFNLATKRRIVQATTGPFGIVEF